MHSTSVFTLVKYYYIILCISYILKINVLQGVLSQVLTDAKNEIGKDIKTALAELLHDKINNFASFGDIQFTVHPSSTVELF